MWRLSGEHCEQGKFCSQILNFHLFFFLKVMSGGEKKNILQVLLPTSTFTIICFPRKMRRQKSVQQVYSSVSLSHDVKHSRVPRGQFKIFFYKPSVMINPPQCFLSFPVLCTFLLKMRYSLRNGPTEIL